MTEAEEIRYLSDLLLQASRWERSEGEVLSGLELEVQDRMRRLTGVETVDENGMCQSVVERGLARQKAKLEKRGTIRIAFPDGSYHRVKLEDVEQVPCMQSPTGYKNIIKEGRLGHYYTKYGITMRGVKAAMDAKENN